MLERYQRRTVRLGAALEALTTEQTEAAVHSVDGGTDGDGNATTTTTDAFGPTGYSYDALGRVTTVPAGDAPANQVMESLGWASTDATAGNITLGYYDTDAARTIAQDGTTTTYALDPGGRRATSTTTKDGADTVTTTRDYSGDGDDPSYATQTVGSGDPVTSVYGSSIGGDLGFTATSGAATLDLADPHGDTITTVAVPADGTTVQLGAVECFDEYGNQAVDLATPGDDDGPTPGVDTTPVNTGALAYGYLGAKQRAADTTGLILMGARIYNPSTGQFTSTDPVPGGNSTAYIYPQDPINRFDVNGAWCTFQVGTTCTRYVKDKYGRFVPVQHKIRQKVISKHGISWGTRQWLISHLDEYSVDGTTVVYRGVVAEYRCTGFLWFGGCAPTGRATTVRMVVNFRSTGGKTFGLVTMYCEGRTVCPSWISNPNKR